MPRALATTSWDVQPGPLSTTARPSGPLLIVEDRALAEELLDAGALLDRLVDDEAELGGAAQAGLTADGRLQADAVVLERLLGLVLGLAERGELHPGAAEVAVDVDERDRHQLEALVLDLLELLGEDLAAELVDAQHPREALRLAGVPMPRHR